MQSQRFAIPRERVKTPSDGGGASNHRLGGGFDRAQVWSSLQLLLNGLRSTRVAKRLCFSRWPEDDSLSFSNTSCAEMVLDRVPRANLLVSPVA